MSKYSETIETIEVLKRTKFIIRDNHDLIIKYSEDFPESVIKEYEEMYQEEQQALQTAISWGKELEKTLCKNCYGKGYSTELQGNIIAKADFLDKKDKVIKPSHIKKNYCDCRLGKALKQNAKTEIAVIETLKAEVEELKKERVKLYKDINNLDEGLHEHTNPHWKMWNEINFRLAQENKNIKEKYSQEVMKRDGEITKLQNKIIEGTRVIDNLTKDNKSLNQHIEKLKSKIEVEK